jgi:hypothetical protein
MAEGIRLVVPIQVTRRSGVPIQMMLGFFVVADNIFVMWVLH